ncbi:tetratricopeptide repeat protein [Microbulbifer sp. 2304DJ12-6]|uniref:tetratricopeptide repeat protein n=1 Tax=Microbulbifer sp. 2304DJ12-6 TaxID=3233340 RepID=UPI0039AEAEE4
MAKRPEQRPESAQQVYAALELVCKHGIDADTQQYSETVTQLLIRPRKKRGRITVGLAGLALLSIAAFWVWQTFMQLPPQYIAVLPVELNGELSGEQDAETLVTAVVRQALMNTPSKLKASALVSYTPRQGTSLEEQLQRLHDQGITDALLARLDCMKQRCNIELQRVNPQDRQIKKQAGFAFIANRRQEAQYTIGHASVELFSKSYREKPSAETRMAPEDYNRYLVILAKFATRAIQTDDLELVEELIGKYPKNVNLYSLYARASASMFSVSNKSRHLTKALGILASAETSDIDEIPLLEAKLSIKSLGTDKAGFESTLRKLQNKGHPSAHLLAEHARFQFNQGGYAQSLSYAKQAVALNPSNANYYLIAINQLATGDYDSTRETLKNLINESPKYWAAYALLGAIELENGSLDIAGKMIGKMPKEVRSWRTKSNLGTVYFLQGKFSKALATFQDLSVESPQNLSILYKLAETHLMLSQPEVANEYFAQIIKLTHEASTLEAKHTRAGALAYIGETADSISLIKDLLRESPDYTYVKYTAVQVYALAGEWQSANYHLEQLTSQGMGAEWFTLPAFQLLCSQAQISKQILEVICQD